MVEQVATCGSASLAEAEGGKPRVSSATRVFLGKGAATRSRIYVSVEYLPIQSKHKSNRQELCSVFIAVAVVDIPKCVCVCVCVRRIRVK